MGFVGRLLVPLGIWVAYAPLSQLILFSISSFTGVDKRAIYLTFDDGPDSDFTPHVLDILARKNVKATFFLIGARAAQNPSIVRRMVREGHEIGNHTWHHRNAWLLTPRQVEEEILIGKRILEDISGKSVSLFRPPWAMSNAHVLYLIWKHHLHPVLGFVQPEGLRPRSPAQQLRYCMSHLYGGAIIDLHDANGVPGAPVRLIQYLSDLIHGIKGRGFEIAPFKPKIN